MSGAPFDAVPDYRYYAERIAQMASRITEIYGWKEEDLLAGSQQTTLLEGGSSPEKPKKGPKGSAKEKAGGGKTASLDSFFS